MSSFVIEIPFSLCPYEGREIVVNFVNLGSVSDSNGKTVIRSRFQISKILHRIDCVFSEPKFVKEEHQEPYFKIELANPSFSMTRIICYEVKRNGLDQEGNEFELEWDLNKMSEELGIIHITNEIFKN